MILSNEIAKDNNKLSIASFEKPIEIKVFFDRIFAFLDHTFLYPDSSKES